MRCDDNLTQGLADPLDRFGEPRLYFSKGKVIFGFIDEQRNAAIRGEMDQAV